MGGLRRSIRRPFVANAFALVLGASALASAAEGQVASLVRDIAPGDIFGGHTIEPGSLYGAGPRLFFFADFGYEGQNPDAFETGLWVSDGTAAGTQPLAAVCPNACFTRFLGSLGEVVFFLAGDGPLWRSDGTRAGTFSLNASGPELTPFFDSLDKYAFLGGFLFFVEKSSSSGRERLWRSDGTVAGTQLVADITPTDFAVRHLNSLTSFRGRLYFIGPRDSDGAPIVWQSDGTSAGTVPLSGAPAFSFLLAASSTHLFFDGFDSSSSHQLWTSDGVGAAVQVTHLAQPALFSTKWIAVVNERALFIAENGSSGQELWTSDGTAAGTRAMTDFPEPMPFAAALSSSPRQAAAAGTRVVFSAAGAVWSSGGTSQSTVKLHDEPAAFASSLTTVGNRVVFFSGDAFDEGVALLSTDGTVAGTRVLEQICGSFTICPDPVATRIGDHLYFAVDSPQDYLLHQTDGTPAGTKPFAPVVQGGFLRFTIDLASFDAGLAFLAFDDSDGPEVWVKDGATAASARKLTQASGPQPSHPRNLTTAGGRAFFIANDSPLDFSTFWQSDGTAASTVLVPDVARGNAASPVAGEGKVFFFAGGDLWRADGSAGGTIRLTTLASDQYLDSEQTFVPYGSGVAFVVSTPSGEAIWTTDGTSAGTAETISPSLLPAGTMVDRPFVAGGELFFTTVEGSQLVTKLWHWSATGGGAQELGRVRYQDDPELTAVGGWFYFVALQPSGGSELWRTDGTAAGTAPLRAGGQVVGAFVIYGLTAVDGHLFFVTRDPYRLWRSDGTEAGTFVVTSSFSLLEEPVALGSLLVFRADDGSHGHEPWVSDGTAAGTRMLRDVMPGPQRSRPLGLTAAPGRVFFTADDGVHGRELWQTDGTTVGTRLVQDIWPGPASSAPSQLQPADGRLYFAANDGLTGDELWRLSYAASGACVSGDTAMCLQGGRYRVETYWHDFDGHSGQAHAVALTADSGYFWFFDAANVEVVLKVLDGSPLNGHAWVFFGSLSNVHYTVTVTDTQTLASRRYENTAGTVASVADTAAFGPRGAKIASLASASSPASPGGVVRRAGHAAQTSQGSTACVTGPTRLCLQQGRFAVDVAWRDFAGHSGVGQASPLTTDTGSFWFFSAANVELMVKVLDGRGVNGKFWVFFAALSTVEYTVTVTDTETGAQRVYVNPSGHLASVADTSAF
jgi:ELWxxDGT repeat protein